MKKPYFIELAYKMGRSGRRTNEKCAWPLHSPEGKAFELGWKGKPLPPLEELL